MKAKTNFRLITRFQPFNLATVQPSSFNTCDKDVSKSLLVITAIGLKIGVQSVLCCSLNINFPVGFTHPVSWPAFFCLLFYLYPILFDVQFLCKFFSDDNSRKLFLSEAFFQAIKLLFSESCSAAHLTRSVTLKTNKLR